MCRQTKKQICGHDSVKTGGGFQFRLPLFRLLFALVAQQGRQSLLLKVLTELLSNKWVTQYRAGTEPIPRGGGRGGGGGFMNSWLLQRGAV